MHVHTSWDERLVRPLMLANGITSVRYSHCCSPREPLALSDADFDEVKARFLSRLCEPP